MKRENNERLEEALAAFPFPGQVVGAIPYGKGHVHETYCVHVQTSDHPCLRYIVQKINTYAFHNPIELMKNITMISDFLRHQAEQKGEDPDLYLTVMRTKDQDSFYCDTDGQYWRVYPFIENSISYDKIEKPEQFYESAKAFGNFQKQLADFDAERLHETIHRFHDTANRLAILQEAVEEDRCGRLKEVKNELNSVMARSDKSSYLLDLYHNRELPCRVTHNDTKLNNVLFDRNSGKAIAVIDLDTVMPGLSAFDFGDSIRFGCNLADEDEKDLSKVKFDLSLYKVFVNGFLRGTDHALTKKEMEVLPWGAYIMTYENAIRFLTDYLQGDLYFRVARPEHNLDRCRTQLKLMEEFEKVWDKMQITQA